jgi:hypothetical protein
MLNLNTKHHCFKVYTGKQLFHAKLMEINKNVYFCRLKLTRNGKSI